MSDDGNESRDSKNTETEEKSTPASPSHVAETKSEGIIIYLLFYIHSLYHVHIYKIIVCVEGRGGGGGGLLGLVGTRVFWMILFILCKESSSIVFWSGYVLPTIIIDFS